ncbi:MAG: endonuclease III [Candidatus Altiarchaeota archaeon]|nr:endonuclease III [Candidatus Altiarchaeota archaeon]
MKREIRIIRLLAKQYPEKRKTYLNHKTVFQLVVATILSAQCTDNQVNKVTKRLFRRYKSVSDFANARGSQLEKEIKSTGYFRSKAKNILGSAKVIQSRFDGRVPKTMDELLSLPGVGRKTANIVLYAGYGMVEGIAVDTHVFRISHRLSLSNAKTPEKTEEDLMDTYPNRYWGDINHLYIAHGRRICQARKPMCQQCILTNLCPKIDVK